MLEHGGRLQRAVERYGIPRRQWLDLSTGINPQGWLQDRAAEIPHEAWLRLPEQDDDLTETAQRYYSAPALLPVAGSQAAIQQLPWLRPACRVGVLSPGYNEHAQAWRRAGHAVIPLAREHCAASLGALDVLVLCNPNNPTGHCFTAAELLTWHQRLARHGGWLVVDEAFMDVAPEASLAAFSAREGLVVLRSLGKFFGLAGARVGFLLSAVPLLDAMAERLGPWTIAGPSRVIAGQALRDQEWQRMTRLRLRQAGTDLAESLRHCGLPPTGGCALFQWMPHARARDIHEALARRGILTRLFDEPAGLRFGLPASDADRMRLHDALQALKLVELAA